MPQLHPDQQREFEHALRLIESDGRQLAQRIARARGGDLRGPLRVAMDKLEVFVADLEDLIFDADGSVPQTEREQVIAKLHGDSDKLIQARAALDRTRRAVRRQRTDLAHDRRDSDLASIEEELATVLDDGE